MSKQIEAMKLALDEMRRLARFANIDHAENKGVAALEQAITLAQSRSDEEQPRGEATLAREPLTFEEWLAKQHGDPEEIGFLQALRIAYIAGQDSITKGNT